MTKRPNIIVFLTDDHARWALPAYGATGFDTPALDGLASRGTVMENAYTNCPVCSPARASFLTGLMPSQHGVRDFIGAAPQFHDQDWLADLDTLPEQLARVGYRCGFSGKWHLGRDEQPARGFDFWNAMSGSYPVTHDGCQEMSRSGQLHQHEGHLTDAITRGAREFLEGNEADQPYFLLVGYYATHSPWQGQPSSLVDAARQKSFSIDFSDSTPHGYQVKNSECPPSGQEAEARLQYRAAVAHIDQGIAAIVQIADETDTIVIYTSDHGLALGQDGLWGKGNATQPLNLFDNSIRIPMLISGLEELARIPRETRYVDHCDLYRILRVAAGIQGTERDGLPRAGKLLSEDKTSQISEYGSAARIITKTGSAESRPGSLAEGAMGKKLAEFYKGLRCQPPWNWQPPVEPRFNPAEAWR